MELSRSNLYAGYAGQSETQASVQTGQLDLFTKPPVERQMLGAEQQVILPASLEDTGPYTFEIRKAPHEYIDLNSSLLTGKISVRQIDLGTGEEQTVKTDSVGICNYFAAALLRSIDVSIAGKNVSKMTAPYLHLKMYLQSLLSYDVGAKDTHLRAAGWSMDDAGKFDKLYESEATQLRKYLVKDSRICDFAIPLTTDIFSIEKLLPDFVNITINIEKNLDSIPLYHFEIKEPKLADGATTEEKEQYKKEKKYYDENKDLINKANIATFKIKIHELALHVQKVVISPALVEEHQKKLNNGGHFCYPMTRTDLRVIGQINTNSDFASISNIFTDRQPNNFVIGLMKTKNLNGSFDRNPFNFDNFKLRNLYVVASRRIIPAGGYTPDFENKAFAKEYYTLFKNIGIHHSNNSNALTPALFKSGYTLYGFDLTPDLCLNYHSHKKDFGSVDVHIKLDEPVKEPVSVICFASFDDVLYMDKTGRCFYEMAGGVV